MNTINGNKSNYIDQKRCLLIKSLYVLSYYQIFMIPLMRFSLYFPGTGISKTSCHKIYTNNSIFRIVCIVKYTANQQPHDGNFYSYHQMVCIIPYIESYNHSSTCYTNHKFCELQFYKSINSFGFIFKVKVTIK